MTSPVINHAVHYQLEILRKYLNDPDVFEIRVNKYGQVVCDTIKGRKFYDLPEITPKYMEDLRNGLANFARVQPKSINNFILPDGSRVILLAPPAIVEGGTVLVIRKHMSISKSLSDLVKEGRFDKTEKKKLTDHYELADFELELLKLLKEDNFDNFLRLAVKKKQNIAITGSTGSGKTVLTRSLVKEIDENERVILMEDINELQDCPQKEVVLLRYGDQDKGLIPPNECLKACMRLTPERILMTELRDEAAWDYLMVTNTGHPGTIFSTHADSATEAYGRIADLVKGSSVGGTLSYEMILKRVYATLDIVIHMENRYATEILYDPVQKRKIISGEVSVL